MRAGLTDLQPEGLRLRPREIEFIALLGRLMSTPRAAKKLVNIYRLIRIGIADDELPQFVGGDSGGPYQAVILLLAIIVSDPALARPLLEKIMSAEPTDGLLALLDARPSSAAISQIVDFQASCQRIASLVRDIGTTTTVIDELAEYQRWAPHVARFSFYTRGRLTPTLDAEESLAAEDL